MQPQDEPAIKALWSYCFESEDHPFFKWYFSDYYQQQNVLTGFQGESLVCMLHLNPYVLWLRGHDYSASYIVGVATVPEGRSQQAVGGLLAAALVEMRQRQQAVVILMPFQGSFYYPYQFEFCYHHVKYSVPLAELKFAAAGQGKFVALTAGDLANLRQVYAAFTSDKHGYVRRSAENWRQLLAEHTLDKGYAYLLFDQDQAIGYVLYSLRDDAVQVREMAYVSAAAEEQLLHFCYSHRSQVSRLEWNAPLDDGLLFSLPDPKQGVALFPFMTGRIVDVRQALTDAVYPVGFDTEVILAVTDTLAPWNQGVFRFAVTEGQGAIQLVAADSIAGAACCQVSIGALSQLFFGRLSASQLKKMGRLIAPSSVIAVLDRLFPVCTNYLNEYF